MRVFFSTPKKTKIAPKPQAIPTRSTPVLKGNNAREKLARKLAAKKAARKRKGRKSAISRNRRKSMRKRRAFGL